MIRNLTIKMGVDDLQSVVVGTTKENGRSSYATSYPGNLSSEEMERFLYTHIFQGLVDVRHITNSASFLKGFVYSITDIDSLNYSPIGLFVLKTLYSPDFPLQFAKNMDSGRKITAWNSIQDKFLGSAKLPIIYRNDIQIKLDGNISSRDSLFISDVIDELRYVIPNRKINLTNEDPNLVIKIGNSDSPVSAYSKQIQNSIEFKQITINFPKGKNSFEGTSRALIYYNLYRALVSFSPSTKSKSIVRGCVFDEPSLVNINYQPFDAFILNTLYSDDFQDQFKKQYVKRNSYRSYLVFMYEKQLDLIAFLLAITLSGILIIQLIVKGTFKPHNWSWLEYNKQGVILAGTVFIFLFVNSLSDLQVHFRFSILVISIFNVLLSINLLYLVEKKLFRGRYLKGTRVLLIFILTFLVLAFLFGLSYVSFVSGLIKESSQIPISIITAIALIRSTYVFLNDRYNGIIHKKDMELAKINEMHKQAELQSLRAKINPHFLYNALNSIASLSIVDSKKTEQMALALSDFFKYSINREQKQFNSLSEELNAIRTYLDIEKVRFGDRLGFEVKCPDELLEVKIPQLIIQPLVENAIKHGISAKTDNGKIRVKVFQQDKKLNIRVYDNGPAFPDGPLSGFGIKNTQDRITILYGNNASINWENEEKKYIEMILPVSN